MSTKETPTWQPSLDLRRGAGGPAVVEADGLGPARPCPAAVAPGVLLAGVVAVALAGTAGWWAAGHPGLDPAHPGPPRATPVATAQVQRQDRSGQTTVDGALGTPAAPACKPPGSGPGGTLLAVDNQPVQLCSGAAPTRWDLQVGVDDAPTSPSWSATWSRWATTPDHHLTVAAHHGWATTAAVRRWPWARGSSQPPGV